MLAIFSVSPLPVQWLRCVCHSHSPTTTAKSVANLEWGSDGSDTVTLSRSGVPGGPVNWCLPIADSPLLMAFKRLSISSQSAMTVAVEGAGYRAGLRAIGWICSVSARSANYSHLSYWLLEELPRYLGSPSWKEASNISRMVSACSSLLWMGTLHTLLL